MGPSQARSPLPTSRNGFWDRFAKISRSTSRRRATSESGALLATPILERKLHAISCLRRVEPQRRQLFGGSRPVPGTQRLDLPTLSRWAAPASTIEPEPASIPPPLSSFPSSIEPGSETEVIFLLGQAADVDAVRAVIARYKSRAASGAVRCRETRRWWDAARRRCRCARRCSPPTFCSIAGSRIRR